MTRSRTRWLKTVFPCRNTRLGFQKKRQTTENKLTSVCFQLLFISFRPLGQHGIRRFTCSRVSIVFDPTNVFVRVPLSFVGFCVPQETTWCKSFGERIIQAWPSTGKLCRLPNGYIRGDQIVSLRYVHDAQFLRLFRKSDNTDGNAVE